MNPYHIPPTLNFSLPHNRSNVPNQQPLVPTTASTPPFSPKQAPIHPCHKLGMPHHPTQLLPNPTRTAHSTKSTPFSAHSHRRSVTPHSTRHIITRTQQHITQMRTPRQLPHRILMPLQQRHRSLRRTSDIK